MTYGINKNYTIVRAELLFHLSNLEKVLIWNSTMEKVGRSWAWNSRAEKWPHSGPWWFNTFWNILYKNTTFYEKLYKSELTHEQTAANVFLENVPQLSKKLMLNSVKLLLWSRWKLHFKALANRLEEVLEQVIHSEQIYCEPGRQISDNIYFIRDDLDFVKSLNLDFGLVALDQEKAFDSVEHNYLWNVLAAFGYSPNFISMIKVLYSDIESIFKVNGDLCPPSKVFFLLLFASKNII